MKATRLPACGLLLACACLGGCTADEYAKMLIARDTSSGKFAERLAGSSDHMLKNKAISAARRVVMPDRVEIDVWILKGSPKVAARGTVLVIHGLSDSKFSYLSLSRQLSEKGFDVVLPDLRAHGRSSGQYVTYGALEKLDQQRVIDQLLKEKLIAEPLYALGTNLGAAVAIDYAAIDPRVQGIVAVAPYRDMPSFCRPMIVRVAPLMNEEDYNKVVERAGEIGKFHPVEASTVAAAARVHCPLLLMHGQLDPVIPVSDSEAIFAAAKGPKQLDIIPWARYIGALFGWENELIQGIEKVAAGRLEPSTRPALEK